jgi:TonB-dependent Receptor Plug Domain
MKLSTITGLLAGAILVACASGGSTGSRASIHRDPNVITAEELDASTYSNVYEAIQHLRPAMLVPHAGGGASSSIVNAGGSQLIVYENGAKLAGVSALRDISVGEIAEIRYLSPTDATQRFGTGSGGGAILLKSR